MKSVFTLEDLSKPEILNPTGELPARLAVLGNPVAHSRSPQLHQPALDEAELNMRYIRLEVPAGELPKAFRLMRENNFVGCNVTVPHKFEALENCSQLDESAQLLGTVNTVHFGEDGKTLGFNTDGPGIVRAIRQEFQLDLSDLRILILGAGGGAGQAIATQCTAEGCEQLILVNRSIDKLVTLESKLLPEFQKRHSLVGPSDRLQILSLDSPSLSEAMSSSDLVIQTTSLGLKPEDPLPISSRLLEPHHLVYDTIYQPSITRFLGAAKERGARTANGLSLLLHQGALSFTHWFPGTQPLEAMTRAIAS